MTRIVLWLVAPLLAACALAYVEGGA